MYLSVEDSGVGIAPEDIARAFENFSQVDSTVARHQQGAGLGLPLSRQLMELHGGTLTLESVVSVGTIATAVLPASRDSGHARGPRPSGTLRTRNRGRNRLYPRPEVGGRAAR